MNRLPKYSTAFFVSLLCLVGILTFGTKHASAITYPIPGAPANVYPQTSMPGDPETYSVAELCAGPTDCMRSKTTTLTVYVPQTMRGQNVPLFVSDGCDNTGIDRNVGLTSTWFYIQSTSAYVAFKNSDTDCAGGNVDMSFTANAGGSGSTQDNFDIYYFIADAVGPNDKDGVYYFNFFRIGVFNANVKVGISPSATTCPRDPSKAGNYPYSCPSTGTAYSSFGQPAVAGQPNGGSYGQKVDILSCDMVMYGRIDLYDLDANLYGQGNVRARLITTNNSTGAQSFFPDAAGANLSAWPYTAWSGNDGHLWFPDPTNSSNLFTFQPGNTYTMEVTNLTRTNTMQILVQFSRYSNGLGGSNCYPNPQGYVDSCQLEAGHTILYGWADDTDNTNSALPNVNLFISGTSNNNSPDVSTGNAYRSADVENFIGIGTDRREYGFRWDAGVLTQGGNWDLQGVVVNVGDGINKQMGINTAPGAPPNGVGYGFPGNKIPIECQAILDVCPNIAGAQATVPLNHFIDGNGDCVLDVCLNLPGGQATVPPPYFKDSAGNCVKNDASCLNVSIANDLATSYPNSKYSITMTVQNTGTSTWTSGTWGMITRYAETDNYLTNGGGIVTAPWPGGSIGNGGTITFTYTTTLPVNGFGNTYKYNWAMGYNDHVFGATCAMSYAEVQGRMGDAFSWNTPEGGSVFTCSMGDIKTGTGGHFTFAVPIGWGYCIRPTRVGGPTAAPASWLRPYSEGYHSCAGVPGGAPDDEGACASDGANYECQVAGSVSNAACTWVSGYDRNNDSGFDIAYAWAPVARCSVSAGIGSDAEVATDVPPVMTVYYDRVANSGPTPASIAGNVKYSLTGQDRTGLASGVVANSNKSVTLGAVTVPPAGTYNQAMSITSWTAYSAAGNPTPYANIAGPSCDKSVNANLHPYVKAFGADITSGGGFGACAGGSGGIYAYAGGAGAAYKGASSQFGILSIMNVNGAYSASNKNTQNMAPKGLTFANTAGVGDPTFGGGLGGSSTCIPDYYNATQDTSLPALTDFPPADTYVQGAPIYGPGPTIPQPPTPVSMFYWTYNGVGNPDYPYCVQWNATATDPYDWGDNYLCSRIDLGLRWSSTGFQGTGVPFWMQAYEPVNYLQTHWDSRYFMYSVTEPGAYRYTWVNGGGDPSNLNQKCVQIIEPSEPAQNSWNDNWVCAAYYQKPNPSLPGPLVITGYQPDIPVAGVFPAGKNRYVMPAGNLTISKTLSIPNGSQIAVYVKGNVYINKDIQYGTGARASKDDIPYFALIVQGNIYIDPSVKRLDGLYVAQPNAGQSATQGRFYTCAPGLGALYLQSQLYASCSTSLAINGAVIAQQIKFLRTINSVSRDGTPSNAAPSGEIPNFADGTGIGNGGNTRAAEVINFSPELFLAPSPLKDPDALSADPKDKYDAIYSLPPVY